MMTAWTCEDTGSTTSCVITASSTVSVDLTGNAIAGFLLYQGIFMFFAIFAFIVFYFKNR